MIRVLVVDDHTAVRRGLSNLLSSADGLECVGEAADGPGALDLVERVTPDVVLLDLSMPGQDGISVTRAIRRSAPGVHVLVLTSFGHADLVVDAVHAGADGYLLAHNDAETILDGLRAVAAGGAAFDPTVARLLVADVRRHDQGGLLTGREREVLDLVRRGHPNKVIARRLNIRVRTVKAHVTHILQRIGVTDRTQAALWAERNLPPVLPWDGDT